MKHLFGQTLKPGIDDALALLLLLALPDIRVEAITLNFGKDDSYSRLALAVRYFHSAEDS